MRCHAAGHAAPAPAADAAAAAEFATSDFARCRRQPPPLFDADTPLMPPPPLRCRRHRVCHAAARRRR